MDFEESLECPQLALIQDRRKVLTAPFDKQGSSDGSFSRLEVN